MQSTSGDPLKVNLRLNNNYKKAEDKGIEPSSKQMAWFSRPLMHHCMLSSIEAMIRIELMLNRFCKPTPIPTLGTQPNYGKQWNRTTYPIKSTSCLAGSCQTLWHYFPFAVTVGIEPTTPSSSHWCSTFELRYLMWKWQDSNLRVYPKGTDLQSACFNHLHTLPI